MTSLAKVRKHFISSLLDINKNVCRVKINVGLYVNLTKYHLNKILRVPDLSEPCLPLVNFEFL